MKISINKWSEVFENSDSRKRERLGWYYAPSGCDSNGYIELMAEHGEAGITAYGVFSALCGIMATLPKNRRGSFVKSNGDPMSIKHLSYLTHIPEEAILRSIQILADKGVAWITSDDLPIACRSRADRVPKNSGFVQGKGKGPAKDRDVPASGDAEDRFPEFWESFGFKKDRPAAEKAFGKALASGADPDAIIEGAKRYNREQQLPGSAKRKYAQGWLTGRRWEDEPTPEHELRKSLSKDEISNSLHDKRPGQGQW